MSGEAPTLRTERLVLRAWEAGDLGPFAELNADPEVMRYFPAPLSRDESDVLAERMAATFDAVGMGMWAVEAPGVAPFVGAVGLVPVPHHVLAAWPGRPAGADGRPVEVGWRLSRAAWGRGYASEAARASLAYGFEELGLGEIVSFTSELNVRSQAVMARIGMTRDPAGGFSHPIVPPDHPLSAHVLYRIRRPGS
jgi:ribosomal-protein-alanine N-acetyltransferase